MSRCLREQERVWDPGHRMAADEDLPQRDAEEDPSEHLGRVLPPRSQTLSKRTHLCLYQPLPSVSVKPHCIHTVKCRSCHICCDAVTVLTLMMFMWLVTTQLSPTRGEKNPETQQMLRMVQMVCYIVNVKCQTVIFFFFFLNVCGCYLHYCVMLIINKMHKNRKRSI